MTSVYTDAGRNVACTVVQAQPNVITHVKTEDTDGYNALQLGYGDAKAKRTSSAMTGHFEKAKTGPKKKLVEFRDFFIDKALGDVITLEEVFKVGDYVSASGVSKGKGFQGVVKRYNFKGVGDATHGQHNRQRKCAGLCAESQHRRHNYRGIGCWGAFDRVCM